MYYKDADKAYREKAWQELYQNALIYIEQNLDASALETAAVLPPISYL